MIKLFTAARFNPAAYLWPALLDLGAAVFEGLSVYLLIPAVQGSIKMDFGFLRHSFFFKAIDALYPGALPSTSPSLFLLLLALIFSASLLKIILTYAGFLWGARLTRRFTGQLRRLIFERILGFGKLFFDRAHAGHLQHVLLGSTELIGGQFLAIQEMVAAFFMLCAYLFLMFGISTKLTLGVLLVFPLMHYAVRLLSARIKSVSRHHGEAHKDLSGYITGLLTNMLLVQSSAAEDLEKTRFARASREIEDWERVLDKKLGLVRPVQEVIFLTTLLLVLFALVFIAGNQRSGLAPALLVYVYLLRRTSVNLNVLGRFNASLAALHGPIAEVLRLLEDKDKFQVPDGDLSFPGIRERIEFKSLDFTFPNGARVLEDISFSVEKGKMTAIVGPSGTGKTTLLNLVLRFYDPPPRTIFMDGADIRSFSLKSLREKLAFISQDAPLFNETVGKNVAYPLDGKVPEDRIVKALELAQLGEPVRKLPQGLETPVGDRGARLSGGERQRLAIARAMLKDAEILILDEATSALDSQTEALIGQAIAALIRGKTAIVIAHRFSTIKNADNIVVIEGGRVLEQGSRQELLEKKGAFHRYWESQKFD